MPFRMSRDHQRMFWDHVRGGSSTSKAAAAAGVSRKLGHRWMRDAGGVVPAAGTRWGRHLTLLERETIFLGLVLGSSYAEIARSIGRPTSTVTRELAANRLKGQRPRAVALGQRRGTRGRVPLEVNYSPSVAQQRFSSTGYAAARPSPRSSRRTCGCGARSRRGSGPITARSRSAAGCARTSPTSRRCGCRTRRSTKALYVQGRGELRRELTRRLRTGRALRKPHRRADRAPAAPDPGHGHHQRPAGRGRRPGRARPLGRRPDPAATENQSAIGTLVERTTRS